MLKDHSNAHKRSDIARIVADIHGVSPDYVRKVRRGLRSNEQIMASLVDLQRGLKKLVKTVQSEIQTDKKPGPAQAPARPVAKPEKKVTRIRKSDQNPPNPAPHEGKKD